MMSTTLTMRDNKYLLPPLSKNKTKKLFVKPYLIHPARTRHKELKSFPYIPSTAPSTLFGSHLSLSPAPLLSLSIYPVRLHQNPSTSIVAVAFILCSNLKLILLSRL